MPTKAIMPLYRLNDATLHDPYKAHRRGTDPI